MCTERSPTPLPPASAQTAPRFLFGAPSAMGTTSGRAIGGSEGARFATEAKGNGSRTGVSDCCPAVTATTRRKQCDANAPRVHKRRGTLRSTPSTHSAKVGCDGRGVKVKVKVKEMHALARRHAHQSVSVKSLHRFTLHLQPSWNQHIAKQKW